MSSNGRPSRPAQRHVYLLAGAVAVLGLAASGAWSGAALISEAERPAGFDRVTVPGAGAVTLAAGAARVLYVEGPDGLDAPSVDDVTVTGPGGGAVALRPYDGDLTYDVPGPSARGDLGTAVAVFTAADPGTYRVSTEAFAGTLAVGRDLAPGTLRAVTLPALLALVSIAAGVGLAVRTAPRTPRRADDDPAGAPTRRTTPHTVPGA